MVPLGEVRRWNPQGLDGLFDGLLKHEITLTETNDDLAKSGAPEGWQGAAADNSASFHRALVDRLEVVVAGVAGVRRGLADAIEEITAVRKALAELDELAARYGFVVGEDARVVETGSQVSVPPGDRERMRVELVERIGQVLRRADDIDADLAAILRRAAHGQISDDGATTLARAAANAYSHNGLSTVEPPPGGTAAQNAGWWATLSEREKWEFVNHQPERIGNLDGLPGAVRDEANRSRISLERHRLQQELVGLHARYPGQGNQIKLQKALREIEEKLASLDAVERTLAQGNRQLLVLDVGGERLKAAVAVGDIDTARHVSVFTPGFGTTVNGDLVQYDKLMQNLQVDALRVSERYGDGGSVATVSWIGYEAPQLVPKVVGEGAARAGSDRLSGFLNGIDASRGDDPHLTAMGHSYGSTTTGLALQKGTGVDDAVFFGSPGVGTENVGDLRVPDGHAYMLENDGDLVADFGRFGSDPSDTPGMRRMSTQEVALPGGQHLDQSTGHSSTEEYMRPGTTSQYNMSVVVAGVPDRHVPGA